MSGSTVLIYNHGNGDEMYTPRYGVLPILQYIPKGAIVWCPFDKVESHFVQEISKTNKVVFSHIEEGKDFFCYEPERWDIIVSNPPFSNKRRFFERCLSFNKPFALLMTVAWLNDAAPKILFAEKDLQLLMLDKRINYGGDNTSNRPPFSSAYFCYNMLPKQIIMHKIDKESL